MAVSAEIRIIDTDHPYQEQTHLIYPTCSRISHIGDSEVIHYEFAFEYASIDLRHTMKAEENTEEQEE